MVQARQAVGATVLAGLVVLAGCSVRVNKDDDGKDKDVSIHTPFGGMQVHKGQHTAVDTGLPVYPGAKLEADDKDDDDKSVDLNMGFGPWQIRVQTASYASSDSPEKVQAFYRKALASYGDVLTCHGDATVGTPVRTAGGLACKDTGKVQTVHVSHDGELQMKAGSERRQHIVSFKEEAGGTHFSLVSLDLPPKGKDRHDSSRAGEE